MPRAYAVLEAALTRLRAGETTLEEVLRETTL
jgi:hypothetical protein